MSAAVAETGGDRNNKCTKCVALCLCVFEAFPKHLHSRGGGAATLCGVKLEFKPPNIYVRFRKG
jgi:hypothetical protein